MLVVVVKTSWLQSWLRWEIERWCLGCQFRCAVACRLDSGRCATRTHHVHDANRLFF